MTLEDREYGAVNVVVRVKHDKRSEQHEWINLGQRTAIDRLGRRNARSGFRNASVWVCENTRCGATADVRDAAVIAWIEAAAKS